MTYADTDKLTIKDAAKYLNVSPEFIARIFFSEELREIPKEERYVLFSELQEYKQQSDTKDKVALGELVRLNQEMGLYD